MREIKFRAWHTGRKAMIHGGDLFLEDHHPHEWKFGIVEPVKVTNFGLVYWVLETKIKPIKDEHYDHINVYNFGLKLMQYTGLKDKNGVEIYEGDIFKIENHWPIYVVKYADEAATFGLQSRGGSFKPFTTVLKESNDYPMTAILGNIYENPEMLEATHVQISV